MTDTSEARHRLELFLRKIDLPHDYLSHFQHGIELKEVICSTFRSEWIIMLTAETLLPIDAYRSLLAHSQSAFKQIESIRIAIDFRERVTREAIIDQYWELCCEEIKRLQPSVNGLLNSTTLELTNLGKDLKIALPDPVNLEIAKSKQLELLIREYYLQHFFLDVPVQWVLAEQHIESKERFKQQLEQEEQLFMEQSMAATKPVSFAVSEAIDQEGLVFGYLIKDAPVEIRTIVEEEKKVTLHGQVFDLRETVTKSGTVIFQFNLTDYTDSIAVKLFVKQKNDIKMMKQLQNGFWLLARGKVEYDRFGSNQQPPELVFIPNDLNQMEAPPERMDEAQEKRVEFHLHSSMSTMDGIGSISDYISLAKAWGHDAIALTDHSVVQAYPEAEKAAKKHGIKMIYGVEANVLNEPMPVVLQVQPGRLDELTYVIFDLETTSLSVSAGEIIELAGVKMKQGQIIDTFAYLIKPSGSIPARITEITNITNEMVADAPSVDMILPKFLEFISGCTLVAHNAKFDHGFIKEWCSRLDLESPKQPLIDTLEMARLLLAKEMKQFNLDALSVRFKVELKSHHRALDDCTATGHIFFHLLALAEKRNILEMPDLNNQPDDRLLQVRPFHCSIYAVNKTGLKHLYKLVSMSHTEYFKKVPCIPKRKLNELREGLLIASGCEKGEFFETVLNKSFEDAQSVAQFYDILEVQPLTTYRHLIEKGIVNSEQQIIHAIERIVEIGKKLDKPVIATGNVHYLHPRDKLNREIIINGIVGYSPLRDIQKPEVHFRTTEEMLSEFQFLGDEIAYDIVVRQTRLLAERFESFSLFPKELFTPHIEGAETEIRETCYSTAREIYGDPLPDIIVKRLEKELVPIIGYGFSANYLISQRLVRKSVENGYLVGSRGSVGSSIVAMMLGISEVNPLPPHYICRGCKYSEWFTDGSVANGFDLPDKHCPNCATMMKGHGHDIPFETFLGFKGDKVPDIDLNFSGEFQSHAHNYTRELFGEKNVFRAGTVGTVAERTAIGYVKKYAEGKHITWRQAEINRIARGCSGVKRSSGQHPGGIIVVPDHIEIEDVTPVQFPADSQSAEWKTTHFDYHSFEENLLKLDILGHDDPTMMHMLYKLTNVDPLTIPMNDPKVMSIFRSTEALGVSPEQIKSNVGTYGIPEMGTKFVRQMLEETNPSTFSDLLQISGLSHGTDVWLGNAQELIRNQTCTIKTVIGCRDEIMLYLIYKAGMDAGLAFTITESVRKGRGLKPEWIEEMKKHKVPQWYIDSCLKIKYMFPKAHAAAYVISAVRTAYYKIYHPLEFYAAYFSIRVSDFDIPTLLKGYSAILRRYEEMGVIYNTLTQTEKELFHCLEMALEMTSRGFSFKNLDIHQSTAKTFVISGQSLIPPFSAVSGCGESVAMSIENARQNGEFLSVDDFQSRSKCSKTVIETLRGMGCFRDLPESNQLTLF